MKINLIAFLLLCFCLSCVKQDRVVNYPKIENKNTTGMEVYQVELADTATILRTELYNRPNNWMRLSSESYLVGLTTGKQYKLIAAPDFELDKEVYMPESGNHPATLLFEPIDKGEEAISFIEGPSEDAFRIEGIQLKKQPVKKGSFTCVLEGELIDRPLSNRLILIRSGKDMRTTPFVSIPIRDGKFKYTLTSDINEAYDLIFWDEYSNGAWRSIPFIAEEGLLNFTFYPMEHVPHYTAQAESALNKEMIRMQEEQQSLFSFDKLNEEREKMDKEERYRSQEMYALEKKIRATSAQEERRKLFTQYDELHAQGKDFSAEGKALNDKFKQQSDNIRQWKLDYIKKEPTLNGLFLLREMINQAIGMSLDNKDSIDLSVYTDIFETMYKKNFSSHPYMIDIERSIASLNVKVGGSYIDFSAPDLNGNMVKLSDQIKGKIAVIDLWASWCGPCRRLSISMIPVYEAYKDKGFTIIGVARENNDTGAMEKAIEKDKYPWLNLVEMNDKAHIWELYGISNAAGMTYLVDQDGKILAVHPSAEELAKILAEKLP